MTPTVGTYTLIVQMCVKSRVGYLSREASTIGHNFFFKKIELILRPVFALISQAVQNTEYIAKVMFIALFFIGILIRELSSYHLISEKIVWKYYYATLSIWSPTNSGVKISVSLKGFRICNNICTTF